MKTPFIVGAYAAEGSSKDAWYSALAEQSWISGLEIPVPGEFLDDPRKFYQRIPSHWDSSALTAIPLTMQRLIADPCYGLASPDTESRMAAVKDLRLIRDHVESCHVALGRRAIRWVQIHSAPTEHGEENILTQSLNEIIDWDWSGAQIVLEHCDSYRKDRAPQKGFLSLNQELKATADLPVSFTINWGRSAIDELSSAAPKAHVRQLADRGKLSGIVFSGAGDASELATAWADAHLPLAEDMEGSVMTGIEVSETVLAANGQADYLGAKICTPVDWDIAHRLDSIRRIYRWATQE